MSLGVPGITLEIMFTFTSDSRGKRQKKHGNSQAKKGKRLIVVVNAC